MNKLNITINDLQEKHQEIAQIIRIENLLLLSKEFGGSAIYVPQKAELEKLRKYKSIANEFDGNNIMLLSKKYDVSESTIYRIVKNKCGNRIKQHL